MDVRTGDRHRPLRAAFRDWSIVSLGRWFRREVTIEPGQKLVRRGPYRVLRHPSYTGLILIFTGFGLAIGSWVGAAAALALRRSPGWCRASGSRSAHSRTRSARSTWRTRARGPAWCLASGGPRQGSVLKDGLREGGGGRRLRCCESGVIGLVRGRLRSPACRASSTCPRRSRRVPRGRRSSSRTASTTPAHAAGAAEIEALLGVPPRLLRDGEGWAVETITHLGTHSSTHVDAPYHYNSTIRASRRRRSTSCRSSGSSRPASCSTSPAATTATPSARRSWSRRSPRAGHELRERDIVLVRTDCDRFYAEPDYMFRGPGVTAEATRWPFDRGVRVMGIDAWGWDRAAQPASRGSRGTRRAGSSGPPTRRDLADSQIERLFNLAALPPTGFTVACFPLKLVGASAAPARVVAIVG